MNKTNKLAIEAKAKAKAMGWEALVKLDQCDVYDMATTVAWKKGAENARYIRFVEGMESQTGWIPVKHAMLRLDYCNCY